MNHPSKAQVQVVIDTLTKANEMANSKGHVSMHQPYVYRNNICGTPMCHGGWYAIGKEEGTDYEDGANMMARDLGLGTKEDLKDWAYAHPSIWGNEDGMSMFADTTAFGFEKDEDLTSLTQIIDHWKGVQERLPA